MADDKKYNPDEEYQYPDNEEYVTDKPSTEPDAEVVHQHIKPKKVNAILQFINNNRRIVIVIVVIIIALIAFKWMSYHQKNKVLVSTKAAQQTSVVQSNKVASANPQVLSQLATLNQQAEMSHNTVSQLRHQVDTLRQQLAQTQASNHQLNQAMLLLVSQLKTLNEKVSTLKSTKQPSAVTKARATIQHIKPVTFNIRAIVPGRAWIVSDQGTSKSVSVGDKVAQYGHVVGIYPNRGLVVTSSGKVIGYGVDDH